MKHCSYELLSNKWPGSGQKYLS